MDTKVLEWWKEHDEVLDPLREMKNDEVDALYVQREDSPSATLHRDLLRSKDPAGFKVILCGARGSGKSTELTRLSKLALPKFVSVTLDVAPLLGPNFGTFALLGAIAAGAEAAYRRWRLEGKGAVASDGWVGVEKVLTNLGLMAERGGALLEAGGLLLVSLGTPAAAVGVAAGSAVGATGRLALTAADVWARLGGVVGSDRAQSASDLAAAVTAILDHLGRELDATALLLVEGFDKAASVEDVFAAFQDHALLGEVAAPAVFTGPVTLRHDARFASGALRTLRPKVLHNLPVLAHGNGGAAVVESKGAVDAMVQMVMNRAAAARMPANALPHAVVREAARMSSGTPREMFRLLYDASGFALDGGRRGLTEEDLRRSLHQRRLELQQVALREEHFRVLREVLGTARLPGTPIVDGVPLADRLLYEGYIAAYPNGDGWVRPNEILVEWLESAGPLK